MDFTAMDAHAVASREEPAPFHCELMAAIFESAQDLVIALDRRGWLLASNPAMRAEFLRIYGRKIPASGPVLDMLADHPEDLKALGAAWARALGGERFSLTCELGDARRERRFYEMRFSPVHSAEGRLLGSAAILRDATERMRAALENMAAELTLRQDYDRLAWHKEALERQLRDQASRSQELASELEHVSYAIIHDMRAPLRSMRGFSSLLMAECGDCARSPRHYFLQRICQAAQRMDLLITDALSYTQAVRHELPLSPLQPDPILRGMVETYPRFQSQRDSIHIEAPMPMVLGNEAGLTECFSQLISNALKFVQPGGVPRVFARAERRPAGIVRIWIEDNGIGIPKDCQEKIFDMFQRLSNDYEGTGIGLALVRKVVQRMGGRVGVDSEPGRGSRFWMDLKSAGSNGPP